MKRTLPLTLLLLLFFGYSTKAQEPLKLQYYKHMAILNAHQNTEFNGTFINENGWLFITYRYLCDSFEFEGVTSGNNGTTIYRLYAYDNTGQLRWSIRGDSSMVKSGIVGKICASGPDNSVYFTGGAIDSFITDEIKMYFTEPPYSRRLIGKIDSTGKIVKVVDATYYYHNKEFIFQDRFYDFGMLISSYWNMMSIVDSSLNEVIAYKISPTLSATIDKNLNLYYVKEIVPASKDSMLQRSYEFIDTIVHDKPNVYLWVLVKASIVNGEHKRKWMHIIESNKGSEINDNKLVKADRYGNIFWTILHAQPLQIGANTVPYYSPVSTSTKASILRFDTAGNFLGYHQDTSTTPSLNERQTIWLENDKDMNVYAYFYSSSRVYNFDEVQFDETYSHKHKILIFDNNSKTFNKAYTHFGGRFDKSLAPPRFIFWHPLKKPYNYTFLDGTFIEPKWNSDYAFTVMDTITPKYPVAVPQIPAQGNDITIYPNPSSNSFIITNNNKLPVVCSVYAMDMRLIEKITLEGDATIELSSVISPGVYFVQCQNNEGFSQTIKIIKQ